MDYMNGLTERLEIGRSIREGIQNEEEQERIRRTTGNVEEPLYGFAGYMVQSLIPSYETLSFQQVADEDDARRIANARKAPWGEQGS